MTTAIANKAYMLFDDNDIAAISDTVENYHQGDADANGSTENSVANFNAEKRGKIADVLEETAKRIREITKQHQKQKPLSSESDKNKTESSTAVQVVKRRKIPRWMSENIFIITLVWQMLCVGSLEAVDAITHDQINRKEKNYFIAGIVLLVALQLINMVCCLSVTIKLFKQYRHKNTSMKFLLHCYIAILFLFGGIYTLIAWISPGMFINVRDHSKSTVRTLDLYSQLLFMSISTGTLCGATTISASHLLTESVMSLQMLLSFLYFTSILSEVVNPSVKEETREHLSVSAQCDDSVNIEELRNLSVENVLSERC